MRHRLLFILLIISGVFAAYQSAGQEYPMLHFTAEDGLPDDMVYQVYRDRSGLLWFATGRGVARYNGKSFETFSTANGLPSNDIRMMCEDKFGRMWLATRDRGLCYYERDTFFARPGDKIARFPSRGADVTAMRCQEDSSMLLSYSDGRILDVSRTRCQVLRTDKLTGAERFGSILYRSKIAVNRYQLICANAVLIVDSEMKVKQQYAIDTFRIDDAGNTSMFAACQNQDYVFGDSAIYAGNMVYMDCFPRGFHNANYVNTIFFALNHKFYATTQGLYIDDSILLLRGQNVSSVTTDRYGNFWISTMNRGVYVLSADFGGSVQYNSVYSGQVLYAVSENNSLLYVAADNKVYELRGGVVKRLMNCDSLTGVSYKPSYTRAFYGDGNGCLWGLVHNKLVCRKGGGGEEISVGEIEHAGSVRSLYCMNGAMYVFGNNSIVKLQADTSGKIFRSVSLVDDLVQLSGTALDVHGNIWFASDEGLFTIEDTGTVVPATGYKGAGLISFCFLGDDMAGLSSDNTLVVSRQKGIQVVTDSFFFKNCIADKIYKIDNSHLLVATNNLYRLVTKDTSGAGAGYRLSILSDWAIPLEADRVVSGDSLVYFMKSGSVTVVRKNRLFQPKPPPKVLFNKLKSDENTYDIQYEVTVPYSESRNITVSFSVISFVGEGVSYQYSFSKTDDEHWVDVDGQVINLVNPSFGNFTVKVRAKNTSSEYSRPVEFTLRVTRPIWASWWFSLLAIVGVVYLIVFIVRRRVAYVLKKKDKEHELQVRFLKSEYKALNALMNPHFIFNTLNNVQGLINKGDKKSANEYIRVIADLIRQNMHNISKELIPLEKEIELVSNYLLLEKLRFKERLNYSIIVDKGLDLSEVMVPPLLIQPLVENSIKHGILPLESEEGSVFINIFERKGSLCIEVKDNGVGINYNKAKKKESHESFGLSNIRKRIEQLSIIQDKEITFSIKERTNDIGSFRWTVVTIVIPPDE